MNAFLESLFYSDVQVDKIIDRNDDNTFSDLLEQDEIIQECIGKNPKLISYLSTPASIEKLFRLIVEPDQNNMKPSCVASQILTCDLSSFWERAFSLSCPLAEGENDEGDQKAKQKPLIRVLFSFFELPQNQNSACLNLFSSVVSKICDTKIFLFLEFLSENEEIFRQLLKSLSHPSILIIHLKLLQQATNEDLRSRIEALLLNEDYVQILIESFISSTDAQSRRSIGETLEKLLTVFGSAIVRTIQPPFGEFPQGSMLSTESSPPPFSPLVSTLLSPVNTDKLLSSVIQSISLEGLSLLRTLLTAPHFQQTYADLIGELNTAISSRLPELCQALVSQPLSCERLGLIRLKLVEFFDACISTNSAASTNLIELGFFKHLLDLLISYPLNNFLHFYVSKMFCFVLYSSSFQILLEFVKQSQLIEKAAFIFETSKNLDHHELACKAYRGHIYLILQCLTSRIQENNSEWLSFLAQENIPDWPFVHSVFLEMVQTREQIDWSSAYSPSFAENSDQLSPSISNNPSLFHQNVANSASVNHFFDEEEEEEEDEEEEEEEDWADFTSLRVTDNPSPKEEKSQY